MKVNMVPSLPRVFLRVAFLVMILRSMAVHNSTLSHATFLTPGTNALLFLFCLFHHHLHNWASPAALVSPNPVGARKQDPPPFSSRAGQQVLVFPLDHNHGIGNRAAILNLSSPD